MIFGLTLDSITSAVLNGLLIAGVALAALIGAILVRFLIALANGENDVNDAARISGRWTGLVLGGAASAGAMGLVQFGDIIGMFTMFIGQHPFAVTNIGIAGLGAALIEGFVSLSTLHYLAIAVGLMGVTLILTEVERL